MLNVFDCLDYRMHVYNFARPARFHYRVLLQSAFAVNSLVFPGGPPAQY